MIIIGEAPSRRGDPKQPLSAEPTRSRLIDLFGAEAYLAAEKANLLDANPGKSVAGKGDDFPVGYARGRAFLLLDACRRARLAVFLGRRVSRAFEVRTPLFFALVHHREGFDAVVIPHPSGINRWWNDPDNLVRARVLCRRLVA